MEKDLSIAVIANGKEAKKIKITPETSDVFRLISLRHLVKTGQNKVTLEPSGKGNLAYQIVAVHYLPWRDRSEEHTSELQSRRNLVCRLLLEKKKQKLKLIKINYGLRNQHLLTHE